MTESSKDLQGRLPIQAFSGARVQALGNRIQFALGVSRQFRPLGEVLAQEPIGILIGPPLPWTMRVGKEHSDGQPLSQAFMLGHLFPSIIGQGFSQRSGDVPEFLGKAVTGAPGIGPLKPCQDDQARGPFHQGAHGRAIAGSLDEIAFPVPRDGAGLDVSRPFGHERHVGDLAAPISSTCPRPSGFPALPQRGQQLAA